MCAAVEDVVVVGAGPAGLMAAIAAASRGRRVVVCERMPSVGRKLLATGGGRCNLTHAATAREVADAFGAGSRFARHALESFAPRAIRDWFAAVHVPTVVQDDGCVFPESQQACDVVRGLMAAAHEAGVLLRCGCPVTRIVVTDGAIAGVETGGGAIAARRVVLAAGGCSYSSLGSDGSGIRLASAVGHTVKDPLPALAPLVTAEAWPRTLAGIVAACASARLDGRKEKEARRGPVLFTHRGVSGPPILDLSGEAAALLAAGQPAVLRMRWRTDRDPAAWRALFARWRDERGGRALNNLLAGELPARLACALCACAGVAGVAVARARRDSLDRLAEFCGDAPLTVQATEGWERAMVTRGGIALPEVETLTLRSRLVRGLHFAGEALDLDGPCGGYNLTWAFASGRCAGTAAARSE